MERLKSRSRILQLICIAIILPFSTATALGKTGLSIRSDSFSCDLNVMCGQRIMEKLCDIVINEHLWRSDNFNYTGGRWPVAAREDAPCTHDLPIQAGCSMYIEGPEYCSRTGNAVWYDYQDIKMYGCKSCGLKKWGRNLECQTVVNFDDNCPRAPGDAQGPPPRPGEWPPPD